MTGPDRADNPGATGTEPFVDEYRSLMSSFPTGVAVITSSLENGKPQGLTCSSLTSVTLSPPTLLVCLEASSITLAVAARSGAFAVNLLHARAAGTARLFSTRNVDRFAQVRWQRTQHCGMPWLVDDVLAVAECELGDVQVVGTHAVVFGQVEAITLFDEAPLLYGRRRFASWPMGEE
ncbi:flavin reductase family protein [Streptomyces sasae]|uniref:flavin reductase family protein n=1 Tax=Streptomyces sasae TaxID=1266772 RepID=UPI00293116C9|nr:flavin reductase family protein [Streptomyces sasae]